MKSIISSNRYLILLFSFLILIFGNTFTPHVRITTVIPIYLNFLTGLLVFYELKWLRNIILFIIGVTILLDVFQNYLAFIHLRTIHTSLYLLFFSVVTREVFREVLYVKIVSRELLAAALCGFVLLCLISTFIFSFIDIMQVNAFSISGSDLDIVDNLNYFSFTTLFTLGFGDIVPLTLVAKRAVMLMGLAGHFYTVFITSIIIGKYISAKNK